MSARRGIATFAFDQAFLVSQGAEALAAYGLRQIYQNDARDHAFYLGQGWDKPVGPVEVVPGVMLTASLEDLQGRFNINNLVDASTGQADVAQVQAFEALLENLELETKWAGYLVDWIDANNLPSTPDGAEDSVYTGLEPQYRTANRYITSISELLALPGFGRDRYMKLAPYIAALPHGSSDTLTTAVNVCTASGAVLDAFLGPGHREYSNEETLAKNRLDAAGCFPTKQNYQASFDSSPSNATPKAGPASKPGTPGVGTGTGGQSTPKPQFTTTSQYFRLTSFITIGSTEFNLYSLLYLEQAGGQASPGTVRPILRSFTPD
jgi:general secretion pathway protein K